MQWFGVKFWTWLNSEHHCIILISFWFTRRPGEDSDGEYYKDSSSDGSSDCELERGLKQKWEQRNRAPPASEAALRMDRLSLRETNVASQEGFSSDEGEVENSQGCLLFEFLEQDLPYSREPLADKASFL